MVNRFSPPCRTVGSWVPTVIGLLFLCIAVPAMAEKDLTVKLPTAGEYSVWL